MKELIMIQQGLKAPKGQYNNFGKYKYRSCEDILEAVKPLLEEQACTLVISDDIVLIGDRFYLKATATLTNSEGVKEVATAFAREQDTKAGMDSSQLTGATSSYARKYALNGLFCIDDTKDADTMDNTQEGHSAPKQEDTRPWMNEKQLMSAMERISAGLLETEKQCKDTFRMKKEYREKLEQAVAAYKSIHNAN
jgi:hypothetical protein